MTTIQIELDDDLLARVDECAARQRVSRNEAIQLLLRDPLRLPLTPEELDASIQRDREAYEAQPQSDEELDRLLHAQVLLD